MSVTVPFIVLLITVSTFAAERNSKCVTPNQENALCIPVRECEVIYKALETRSEAAIDFAKKSQCGYDTTALVCCGLTATLTTTTTDIFDGIFSKAPPADRGPTMQGLILGNYETKALPDRTVCGLEKESVRVTGGNITELDEFPWMAALEYKSKLTGGNAGIRCGGSVINNRYVLTAAHCIIDKEFELISVWLGEWRISTDPDCQTFIANEECADEVVKLKIKEEIAHPYYSKKSGNNDIGLLRLERDIKYTDYIRPICMPPPNLPFPELNAPLTVAGWGITENKTSSDVKLKVAVPLISNTACKEKLNNKPISPNQLCAGGEAGKDSCQGDSGGPLMRTYHDSLMNQAQWYQEGVVSWGVGCGRVGYPAIYTRVSRYISWIINIISEE